MFTRIIQRGSNCSLVVCQWFEPAYYLFKNIGKNITILNIKDASFTRQEGRCKHRRVKDASFTRQETRNEILPHDRRVFHAAKSPFHVLSA